MWNVIIFQKCEKTVKEKEWKKDFCLNKVEKNNFAFSYRRKNCMIKLNFVVIFIILNIRRNIVTLCTCSGSELTFWSEELHGGSFRGRSGWPNLHFWAKYSFISARKHAVETKVKTKQRKRFASCVAAG